LFCCFLLCPPLIHVLLVFSYSSTPLKADGISQRAA